MFYHAHPRLPIFGGNRINPQHPLDNGEDAATTEACDEHQMSRVSGTLSAMVSRRNLIPLLSIIACIFAMTSRHVAAGPLVLDLVPGQEWTIKSTRPTTAKVIIGRVESWRDKTVVSVSIVQIPVPQGLLGAGGVTQIAHIPFEKSALVSSLDRLIATGILPAPNFEGGYDQWKSAKGGIFTISVEKAIQIMFQTVNRTAG